MFLGFCCLLWFLGGCGVCVLFGKESYLWDPDRCGYRFRDEIGGLDTEEKKESKAMKLTSLLCSGRLEGGFSESICWTQGTGDGAKRMGRLHQVVSYKTEDETVNLVLEERRARGNPQRGYLLAWLERPSGSQEMSVGFRGWDKEWGEVV